MQTDTYTEKMTSVIIDNAKTFF